MTRRARASSTHPPTHSTKDLLTVHFCKLILSGVSSSISSHADKQLSAVRQSLSLTQPKAASWQNSIMHVVLASVLPRGARANAEEEEEEAGASCMCGWQRTRSA